MWLTTVNILAFFGSCVPPYSLIFHYIYRRLASHNRVRWSRFNTTMLTLFGKVETFDSLRYRQAWQRLFIGGSKVTADEKKAAARLATDKVR